jgi:hypothetical protein
MTATQPIDVRDMAIVHRTFRKAYDESAQLVRAAPTPSPERVTFLADHIDFAILARISITRAKTSCSTRS